jgi:hypothetical protein
VKRSRADVVLVARGVPAQDVFIDRCLPLFGVKVALGVGGLFDFVSGRISRAPQWMRDSGLEWIWRLRQEPGRMWQRYLIGNLSFLGRVALQRMNLRPTAPSLPLLAPLGLHSAGHCIARSAVDEPVALLFATALAHPEIPVGSDFPAALLPFGPTSFIERAVAQLAQAGVRRIHIVACARPDLLRGALGDGSRWGTQLTWHVIKDARNAPAQLCQMPYPTAQRVVLGWAHHWISGAVLQRLTQFNHSTWVTAQASDRPTCGWSSMPLEQALALTLGQDLQGFEMQLLQAPLPKALLSADEWAHADTPAQLIAAQHHTWTNESMSTQTQAWIPMPWGAMSPQAHISPAAHMEGPAWVGPNCVIEAGARVGPHTVLVADVLVGSQTHVAGSIILPDTLVGRGLELIDSIACGHELQNVRLGVRMDLSADVGLLASLQQQSKANLAGPSMAGRALAVALVLTAAPLFALNAIWSRWIAGSPLWQLDEAVVRWNSREGCTQMQAVRSPDVSLRGPRRALAQLGPILDIAEGHRRWFGVRPRTCAHWYVLHPDWQALLDGAPCGWLHAPAWSDASSCPIESRAVADLSWLMRPKGWRGVRSILKVRIEAGLDFIRDADNKHIVS